MSLLLLREALYPPEREPPPEERYGRESEIEDEIEVVHHNKREHKITVDNFVFSFLISFFLAFTYLYGLIAASRESVWWEMGVVFIFPLLASASGFERWTSKRQRQLMLLEGGYNMLTVITKILIIYNDSKGNKIMNYLYIVFFCCQVGGFLSHQAKEKQWVGATMSLTMAISITIQRYEMRGLGAEDATANRIDASGRFLMWGDEAGVMMKLNYLAWVTNVLLVDYARFAPAFIIPAVHYASVIMSWWSGEFWHARLITASHIFIVDGIFYFKLGIKTKDWCRMSDGWVARWKRDFVPSIAGLALIFCLSCVFFGLLCGQSNFYCFDTDYPYRYTGP